MEMTYERAAEILDPEHRENYDSIETVKEACRMGMDALKKQIPIRPKLLDEAEMPEVRRCVCRIHKGLPHRVDLQGMRRKILAGKYRAV